jgi:predicted 3-demethylubiquinone-9 3-methyltransferase (glyoxalase superfamily)
MQTINPCLWFNTQAEEAAQLYTSLFESSRIGKTAHYGESGAQVSGQKKGSTMTVEFELEGHKFLGLNGGPHFQFTPAISFFLNRRTEQEINRLWSALSKDGKVLMELQKYPWSEKYGWCQDRFGVSWQLMLWPEKNDLAPSFLFVDQLFGKGEEAIHFYTSQFKNSKIETMHKDPKTNTVMHASFSLDGNPFVLMEGQGEHKHQITPAISFVVNCSTQAEVDLYWDKLCKGGTPGQCGWLTDRFGVSWQIVPTAMAELMSDADTKKTERVMKAMLQMKKLDIEKLKQASMAN